MPYRLFYFLQMFSLRWAESYPIREVYPFGRLQSYTASLQEIHYSFLPDFSRLRKSSISPALRKSLKGIVTPSPISLDSTISPVVSHFSQRMLNLYRDIAQQKDVWNETDT